MGGAVNEAPANIIKKAHKLLGRNNENDERWIASHLGWTIIRGYLVIWESCENAKAMQKIVPKVSKGNKATSINGRWFHDNSTLKVPKDAKGTSKI
jgi:hypothetical protein